MTIENICMQTQKELKNSLYNELKTNGYSPIKRDGFIFSQGRYPVLLVAHLDTVHKERVKHICYSKNGNIIMSPEGIGGDDRCGVYMILEIIKKINCSVLFTEDEEIGAIGASKFVKSNIKPKEINYIIELDRRGSNDAVFYDCDNKNFTEFITCAGFKEKSGSFSDISEIAPHLGIAAVNLSSGYYNAHTQHEYIDMAVVKRNIKRVSKLILKDCCTFEYIDAYDYSRNPYSLYQFDNSNICEKDLMNVTEKMGYAIDDSGEVFEDDIFIDSNNRIYLYDWDYNLAYETESIHVKNHDGGTVRYDKKLAYSMMVVNTL